MLLALALIPLLQTFAGSPLSVVPSTESIQDDRPLESPQDSRSPVPSEDEQARLRERVRLNFAPEYERADGNRKRSRELALELLELSARMDEEPEDRFGVLVEALDLATAGLDLKNAVAIIDRLDELYAPVDTLALRTNAVLTVAPDMQRARTAFAGEVAVELVRAHLAAEDLAAAAAILAALDVPVRKWGPDELTHSWDRCSAETAAAVALRAARATLATNPDDPAANSIVGQHLAFVLGDLAGALAHLELGASTALADCVRLELAQPEDPGQQEQLADAWLAWAASPESSDEGTAAARAVRWYERALAGLPTLEGRRIEKKLAKARASLTSLDAGRPVAAAEVVGRSDGQLTAQDRRRLGAGRTEAIQAGLDWLVAHQSPEGHWDSDGYGVLCEGQQHELCEGAGQATHDVGVTGLALMTLLPFATDASSDAGGSELDHAVRRGVEWLVSIQHEDGLLATSRPHDFLYSHAVATQALLEARGRLAQLDLDDACRGALELIHEARNPYGAWRYDLPAVGSNDTSITTWMIVALEKAKQRGFEVSDDAYQGTLAWIQECTDPETGRIGYASLGGFPPRVRGINDHFPPEGTESTTAAGLYATLFCLDDQKDSRSVTKGRKLLLASLPEWEPGGLRYDLYYWYCGTEVMHLSRDESSSAWKSWDKALERALVAAQSQAGHARGSWDPDCVWGFAGGRVYSTAMATMALSRPVR